MKKLYSIIITLLICVSAFSQAAKEIPITRVNTTATNFGNPQAVGNLIYDISASTMYEILVGQAGTSNLAGLTINVDYEVAGGSGDVSKSGTPLLFQIPIFIDGNTIMGFPSFQFDGSGRFTINDPFARATITSAVFPFELSRFGGAADKNRWVTQFVNDGLQHSLYNDAGTIKTPYMTINRTAAPQNVTSVRFISDTASITEILEINGTTSATLEYFDADDAPNNKRWNTVLDGGSLIDNLVNDAGVKAPYKIATRSDNTMSSISYITNTLSTSGDLHVADQIGVGTISPHFTAALDIVSTTRGIGFPILTTLQRDAIATPKRGLFIYHDEDDDLDFYNGTSWRACLNSPANSIGTGGIIYGVGSNSHSVDDNPTQLHWDTTNLRLGVGTDAPLAKINSLATTEQLRLSYDASNFSSFTTSSSGDLIVDPSGGDMGLTGKFTVGTSSSLSDLTIFQTAGNNKGLTLSGVAVSGSSTTEGVSLVCGNNSVGNNQLWIINKVDQGNSAKNSFRFITGGDVPLIVGVNNIGTLNRNLAFGFDGAGGNCGFGFPGGITQSEILAKVHANAGISTMIPIIAQGVTSQTANLFEVRNVGGSVLSSFDANGDLKVGTNTLFTNISLNRVGIGTITPTSKLDVLAETPDTDVIFELETTGSNGGQVEMHVGSRNPNTNVTATGGARYFRSTGGTSNLYFNRSFTTSNEWDQVSTNPTSTIEIHNSLQLDELSISGVITIATNTTLIFKKSVTTSNRFVVNSGVVLHISAENTDDKDITYTGTGTFLTTAGGTIRLVDNIGIVFSSTGPLMAFSGKGSFWLQKSAIIGCDNLGTFTDGRFLITESLLFSCSSGWTITNPTRVGVSQMSLRGSLLTGSLFTINTNNPTTTLSFNTLQINSLSATSSVIDISSKSNNNLITSINDVSVTSGTLFKLPTLTDATINSVAEAAIVAGITTSRVDNGAGGTKHFSTTSYFDDEVVTISDGGGTGIGHFAGTFHIFNSVPGVSFDVITPFFISSVDAGVAAAGAGYVVGEILTLVGGTFTTPATYQVFSILGGGVTDVTLVSAGNYTVRPSAPAATTSNLSGTGCTLNANWSDIESGTITASDRIALTLATGHGITIGDDLKIVNTKFYNGFAPALNVVADVVTIVGDFKSTNTGNIKINLSLDQTDPRINANNNFGFADSRTNGSIILNSNTTSTTITTQNEWVDISTVNTIFPSTNTEGWRLTEDNNGILEYILNEPYSGAWAGTFSVLSPGSQHYEYRIVKEPVAGGGFVVLPDAVIVPFSTNSAAGSFAINVPITAIKGDQFKSQFRNIDGEDNMTITNLSMGPTNQ